MTESSVPAIGATAPDFTLKDQYGQDVSLAGFRGDKAVVVVFFPFAFSGICTGELCEIRDDLGAFANDDVQVLADLLRPHVHAAGLGRRAGVLLPRAQRLLAARCRSPRTTASSSRTAGSPRAARSSSTADGVVRWSLVNGPGEKRDFGGYHAALKELVQSQD